MLLEELQKKVLAVEKLQENFSFVKNDILRTNIAIAFQCIVFLTLVGRYIKGPLRHSLYKTVIINTSSIVESLIYYCLRELINHKIVESSEIMGSESKLTETKELYVINGDDSVVSAIKRKTYERLTDKTTFIELNRAACKAGIFDKKLFGKAEELRNKRNTIHLAGLEFHPIRHVHQSNQSGEERESLDCYHVKESGFRPFHFLKLLQRFFSLLF